MGRLTKTENALHNCATKVYLINDQQNVNIDIRSRLVQRMVAEGVDHQLLIIDGLAHDQQSLCLINIRSTSCPYGKDCLFCVWLSLKVT